MKKFIFAVLLALPCYAFAEFTSQELYEQAGVLYENKDYQKAISYFKQAADKGSVRAQFTLGIMYFKGVEKHLKQDSKLALYWLTQAANQGNPKIQYFLGGVYLNKANFNPKLAERWLSLSAKQGYKEAQQSLAGFYYNKKSFEKARFWFRKAAEQDDVESAHMLGLLYLGGKGGDYGLDQSIMWLTKAAEKDHDNAQYALGKIYASDLPAQDVNKARMWLTKAAKTKPEAQKELDALPKNEIKQSTSLTNYRAKAYAAFVDEEYEAAKIYALKAVKQSDNAAAQALLGELYYSGRGVRQDYAQAFSWFEKSASQGYQAGQYLLGRMYFEGKGTKQDYLSAHNWFIKAANQNDEEAQFMLAKMYGLGLGIKEDDAISLNWLKKAAANGHSNAIEVLKEVKVKPN